MHGNELGAQTQSSWLDQGDKLDCVFNLVLLMRNSTIFTSVGNTPNQSFFEGGKQATFNIRDTHQPINELLIISRKRQMSFKFRDSHSYMHVLYSSKQIGILI